MLVTLLIWRSNFQVIVSQVGRHLIGFVQIPIYEIKRINNAFPSHDMVLAFCSSLQTLGNKMGQVDFLFFFLVFNLVLNPFFSYCHENISPLTLFSLESRLSVCSLFHLDRHGTWAQKLVERVLSCLALSSQNHELHNCSLFIAALPVFVLFGWPELSSNLHS